MYRPHFCAECGEQVVRLKWRPWTSRSFCDGCVKGTRRLRLAVPVLVGVLILGGGFAAGRALQSQPPPLMVLRGGEPATAQPLVSTPASPQPVAYGADGTATERPTEANETIYTCGARTKKGTPCSRRVRFPGRCYQHKGLPAMLPQEQLVVKG
ncbi:MAG: hypothetical protein ABIP75_01195 [Pyrinomonadaceae bacterium]